MTQIIATVDCEIVHDVEDANPSSSFSVEQLKIQCDRTGLTIVFPRGDLVVINYSRGSFKVSRFNDNAEIKPVEQFDPIYS